MAISRLTGQDQTVNSGTQNVSATYPLTATAGNLLIAVVTGGAVGTNSITVGGTWTKYVDVAVGGGGSTSITLFYKLSLGNETTVTAHNSAANGMGLDIFEYTGNANPIVTDGTALGNSGTSPLTTKVTPTITTTNANDLIFTCAGFDFSATSFSWTIATVIGSNILQTGRRLVCGEDITSTTQASFSDTISWTSNSGVGTIIAAFQAAASGPTVSDAVTTTEALQGYWDQIAWREQVTIQLNESVSVSDSTTTSENIAVQIVGNGISVQDSTTASESVAVLIPFLLIAISDTTSTSESITLNDIEIENILDALNTSESVTLTVISFVNKSDSVSTSESINLLDIELINVTDNVSTNENIALLIPTLFINVSDTLNTSESISVSIAVAGTLLINILDTITTSESITLLVLTLLISVFDTVTTSESITVQGADGLYVTDSTSITESIKTLISFINISVNDAVVTSENISLSKITNINVSDTVNTSEVILLAAGVKTISTSNTVTTTENVTLLISLLSINVNDVTTITENVQTFIPLSFQDVQSFTIVIPAPLTFPIIMHSPIPISVSVPNEISINVVIE